MKLSLRKTILSASSIALLSSSMAYGGDQNLPIVRKNILPNAVTLNITDRGMTYFQSRLNFILGNVGVSFEEGFFNSFTYQSPSALTYEQLAKSSPETAKIVYDTRALLSKWIAGFSLADHRPAIRIGKSEYFATFNRFALISEPETLKKLGKTRGAVLAIELEIEELNIKTQSVRAWDMNNDWLGEVGVDKLKIKMGSKRTPLKLRLPFYVVVNSAGLLEFQALKVDTNVGTVDANIGYDALVTPNVAITINGKSFRLNTAELDKTIKSQLPAALQKVRSFLQDFANKQMPEFLNTKVKESIKGSLEQKSELMAPGSPETCPVAPQIGAESCTPLLWGQTLMEIGQVNGLQIKLGSYVEDPLNTKSLPRKSDQSRGAPDLASVDPRNYDVALSVDRALINRILQLSFERGNFSKIPMDDGSALKLVAPPSVDYAPAPRGVALNPQESYLKLKIVTEQKPDSFALKETVVISFDLIAKLRPIKDKKGLQIVLHSIDLASAELDSKYRSIIGKLIPESVILSGVRKELQKKSASWGKTEVVIPGNLPLPPEVMGIAFKTHKLMMDPRGHLVMFLEYRYPPVVSRSDVDRNR